MCNGVTQVVTTQAIAMGLGLFCELSVALRTQAIARSLGGVLSIALRTGVTQVVTTQVIAMGFNYALAMSKRAAFSAGLSDALSWGTHAFRQGWADEALQHGGPNALFCSGG